MRIVRFSSPNHSIVPFKDQKISLRKLSQVKALSSVQYYQQKPSTISKPNEKKSQSHIKWVPQSQKSIVILNNFSEKTPSQSPTKSPKKVPRRKIFESKDHSTKENVQIPTFSKMPQMNPAADQQTQYFSMMMLNSPKQSSKLLGSKVSESREAHFSPFKTNVQNSRFEVNHNRMISSNVYSGSADKSSIAELTEHHIPKLQQKLKEHDHQLSTIKKYLKNTDQLNTLKESIKEYQEIQALKGKEIEIQRKRVLLIDKIQEVRNRQTQMRKKSDQEANSTIKHIQEQRLKRLEKIQKENQRLYQNLRSKCPQEGQEEYQFKGPIAFPSKDWQSEREIMMPQSEGFHKSQFSRHNASYQKGSNTGELQLSPIMKRKMNEISLIGFQNNKSQQFSMEANTFRDFTSPLDFQGQNDTW